jgi:hypothetical protein
MTLDHRPERDARLDQLEELKRWSADRVIVHR